MPLYNPSTSGSGGGLGAVTLIHPDGSSEIFEPLADGILERGAALNDAIATAVANDLIILGPGTFSAFIPFVLKGDVHIKGQGKFQTIIASATENEIAATYTAGQPTFLSDLQMVGFHLVNTSLNAQRVRFSASAIAGESAIFFQDSTGFDADSCDFLSGVESLTAAAPGYIAHVKNCTANIAAHANVGFAPPSGIIIDPLFT